MDVSHELQLTVADESQVEEIARLVNSAYRGEEGWTRETDIVRGSRIEPDNLQALISRADTHLLVATDKVDVAACVCIEERQHQAYIGMLAVKPAYQNMGLGKAVLAAAERHAADMLGAREFIMVVVSQRTELIEYYERRGYERSGITEPYPVNLGVGEPRVEGLTLELLTKPSPIS